MPNAILSGVVLDESVHVTLSQACRICGVEESWLIELVAEGVVEPATQARESWQFDTAALRRLRVATRLHRDLGVNPAGAALAIELMEEIERMRTQLIRYGR